MSKVPMHVYLRCSFNTGGCVATPTWVPPPPPPLSHSLSFTLALFLGLSPSLHPGEADVEEEAEVRPRTLTGVPRS